MKIFSGSCHPKLTEEVARELNLRVSQAKVTRFSNTEVKVQICENVINSDCVIIQPTSRPTDTHLMELFFFADALRRQEARKVIGVIPYFGYARQDIQHLPGECVSANVIIRFLESIGFDKIYTIDLHDEATEGVFSIPFKNISALPLLAFEVRKFLEKTLSITKDELVKKVAVVSPDQGGVERARKFSRALFSREAKLAVVEKKRDLIHAHQSEAMDLYGDVNDKIVILVDDIITSGRTLFNAASLCLKAGAIRILAAVIHHDFTSESLPMLEESLISNLFTTNTIPHNELLSKKIIEISVAQLIANELKYYFS